MGGREGEEVKGYVWGMRGGNRGEKVCVRVGGWKVEEVEGCVCGREGEKGRGVCVCGGGWVGGKEIRGRVCEGNGRVSVCIG